MASPNYYDPTQQRGYRNLPLPAVPQIRMTNYDKPLPSPYSSQTLLSPDDEEEAYSSQSRQYRHPSPDQIEPQRGYDHDPFGDEAAIPMQQTQHTEYDGPGRYPFPQQEPLQATEPPSDRRKKRRRKKEPWLSRERPWFIYTVTTIQIIVFIVQIIRNAILTGSPIEIHPAFNPMIGPSPYVLINMGARYVPCMRNQDGVQNSNTTLAWPCPDQTTETPSCTLSELCGFNGVPDPQVGGSLTAMPAPNQWFRFIIPIFLHAGIIHIGFNMLLQLLLGGDMERIIGPIRLALVYFSSGVFGFVMGGDFAASGIASCGASGSIFGIIALTLLDLLYTWPQRPKPCRDLLFIVLDICVSFVLGLLPGLDNFSHIGGFLMGLVLGICLLRSPSYLRKPLGTRTSTHLSPTPGGSTSHLVTSDPEPESGMRTSDLSLLPSKSNPRSSVHAAPASNQAFTHPRDFFADRKPLWWAWWLIRAGALVGVIVAFIVLLQSFYSHHDTQCPNCKYLSCLPVSNWCEIGDLTFLSQNTTSKA